MTKRNQTLKLTESAVMIALGFILSFIKVVEMPYGGSVTAFSMVPIIIIAYRHKTVWGLVVGFAYSLLQLVMGLSNLSYATSAAAAVAIVMLDYVVAFVVLGLAGIFRGKAKDQGVEIALGALLCGVLRFICHIISGCTVWAGVSIPSEEGLIYSIGYNATYMIPEILLSVAGAYFMGKIFTLTDEHIVRRSLGSGSMRGVLTAIPLTLASVISFAFLFSMMQDPNDGSFDITGVASTPLSGFLPMIVTLVIGIIGSAVVFIVSGRKKKQ